MAPPKGASWSRDPLRDRREDELAIDAALLDTLEREAARLRSRMASRRLLAQGILPPRQTESAPPLERRSA